MRIMVALENRFFQTESGRIYSTTVCDYNFWERYLQVFDEVVVMARVTGVAGLEIGDRKQADGPGVSFYTIPTFIGPWQFLRYYLQLRRMTQQAIKRADAFMLRIPGTLSTLIWHSLKKQGIPYGVEVVGNPWDSFAPGSVRSITRPFVRSLSVKYTAEQCKLASTASYVTEYSLQKWFPPGCWSTHYSSVELASEIILSDSEFNSRIINSRSRCTSSKPFHICHIGMMEHFYKAPDVLLDAVAICINKGLNIELSLIGDGRFRSELENRARELGIAKRVNFVGKIPPGQAVYDELDKANMYVLPSRQEGLPRTVIEAMARGLPCISSTVGGIPELLDSEFLVCPGKIQELASKIEWVMKNPDMMEKMASQNVKTAKKYTFDELNRKRIEHFKRLRTNTEEYLSSKNENKFNGVK